MGVRVRPAGPWSRGRIGQGVIEVSSPVVDDMRSRGEWSGESASIRVGSAGCWVLSGVCKGRKGGWGGERPSGRSDDGNGLSVLLPAVL